MKDYNRVELSRSAFRSNLDFFNGIVSDDVTLAIVIKSNAYGHGIREIASMAIEYKVEYYCVFSLMEARILRESGIKVPILVLGYISPDEICEAIEKDIRITVYSIEVLGQVARASDESARNARIHLKLETGTNRFGFTPDQLDRLIHMMPKDGSVIIEGVFTHFANIEDTTDHSYAMKQLGNFNDMIEDIEKYHGRIPIKHCACSAAILLFPDSGFSMVRLGVSLYGLWPSKETYLSCMLRYGRSKVDNALNPVICWKTIVAQVKKVPKGEFIGYGCTYRTTRDSTIAVLPTGYSDGYDRLASGRSYVLIHGERAPIRGRICMNLMMVDVTDIREVRAGDEVVLLGTQKRETITAEDLAGWTETINYEVVTRIGDHLPRRIID